jgi:hypothetical protein
MLELIGEAATPSVLAALTALAVVAGLVRGLSGFGSAMIFIPIAARSRVRRPRSSCSSSPTPC